MSEKKGAPRPTRGGSAAILRGLAVGALLSAPVAPVVAADGTKPATVTGTVAAAGDVCGDTGVSAVAIAFREQFRASFTPGVVAPADDPTDIICP
jgi:hypothetical protein